MRRIIGVVATIAMVTCTGWRLLASFAPIGADDARDVLGFARRAAVQALTFQQGDRQALAASHQLFTDAGWQQFLKDLQGWLDTADAPIFTSSFVASGRERVLDERDGIIHVRIPGTLTQSQGHVSKTTYNRFAVDVWVTGNPLAVQRLTQTACAGAATACE